MGMNATQYPSMEHSSALPAASCRGTATAPRIVDELVVNWHVTEACNYRCRYCYSHWEREPNRLDVIRNEVASRDLIEALWQFFRPDNDSNPLRRKLQWSNIRLSLAGGEPMLHARHVARVARHAKALGMRVSMITNGSLLPRVTGELNELARSLDMLGLSIDAISDSRNRAIGRTDRKGGTLSLEQLVRMTDNLRTAHPGLSIKVNTVVNAFNVHDDLRGVIDALRPDRWKLLRVLPVVNKDLVVSDTDFAAFVARHACMETRVSVEDNRDMLSSYLMVDPQGRFFQNGKDESYGYVYSQPITPDTVERAFLSVPFDACKFASRY
jgi:radical S-adenosyl methionine domain-containing protein 2